MSREGKVYAWDRKGEGIEGWPVDFSTGGFRVAHDPRLVDVNRDGHEEVVLVLRSTSGSEEMRVLKGDGTELASWRFAVPSGMGTLLATPLIADFNQDNRIELAYATSDGNVEVYRHSVGFVRLDAFAHDFGAPVILVAVDLENDGRLKLYAVDEGAGEITVWAPDGVRYVFASLSGAQYKGGASAMDVDGDGRPELVVGTSTPELIAYDEDGEIVRHYPLPSVPAAPPMIADIDLDMEPDLIVLLADRAFHAVHANGSKVRRFDWRLPFEAGDAVDTGIVAFDLYEGLVSSVAGWDLTAVYKVSREDFVQFTMGENVHVYDRILAEMEMPVTRIDEVVVYPKVITPNDDDYNDDAELSYILSTVAQVTVDVLDSAGNKVYRAVESAEQGEGHNTVTIDGLNTKGTITPNDDEPLPKGLYYLRLTAMNDLGLASRVMSPLIVFGVRAEIDLPSDGDEEDDDYPVVYGTVGISGIATDPNIGEGNDNFDFLAYKVYYRPGAWDVDEEDVLAVGDMGSPWLPVPVPLQHQSPENVANETADASYPESNVSVRPVQHGLLAQWDSADSVATPNGVYTLLLKVVDGNGNVVGRVNFDTVVVDLQNLSPDTPYDPNDPSTDPNDPENIGPVLSGVGALPTSITTQMPETTISYTLSNETSDINISIYEAVGGQVGPVVASFAQGAKPSGSYSFSWNGKDNLNKRVDVGYYRARVTASAVDGTGGDAKTTSDIHMNVATEYNTGLAILGFALSSDVFDPFDFVTDGNGNDVLADELTASYTLNRYARIYMGVYDEYDALVRTLSDGTVDKIGAISWNGADDGGVIVISGKTYTVRIRAECIDAGCTDIIEDEVVVEVRALSLGGMGVGSDLTMLIGDGDEGGSNPDEIAGILHDDDDPLNDFPLNGSADFSWRAYGRGYIRVPFTYSISANGEETYNVSDHREAYVTPENVPITSFSGVFGPSFCEVSDFRLDPTYSISQKLSFDSGYQITSYGYSTHTVSAGIVLKITSPAGTQQITAPYSFSQAGGGQSVSFNLHLQGRPLGAGGLSASDQTYIKGHCSHGNDFSLCNSLGYTYNPTTAFYLLMCQQMDVPPKKLCGSWFEWSNPVATGPDAVVAPVTCGSVYLWADARKQMMRPWGPYLTSGNSLMHSVQNPGAMHVADYSGATSSGQPDVVLSWVSDYSLAFTPTINGLPHQVSGTSGYLDVGGIIRAWLGSSSGPGSGGGMYTDIIPGEFETTIDTQLSSNTCVFDGDKYVNGVLDTAVQTASRRCITGEVSDINEDYFRLDSGPYSVYASYPLSGHPLLYTFSDIVHVTEWTVDLRYPDGSVNESFELTDMYVNSSGTRDVDGDGTPESNKNTNDTFKLELKSNAAPKRLIEVRGAVNGETWELRYFDANTNVWTKIADGEGARNGTLAWWDVSRLNGREYTVLLRAMDDIGDVMSEDTMEVAIGTEVRANEPAIVSSPYRRYSIHFDEYSLCPEEGPYPCGGALDELVTIIPIPQDTPGLYIPSGINPIGPVIEIKPDDIEINPIYQPQLEVYFTREEIEEIYAQEPQEVQDYVYGITAGDASVMAIYNLKADGELEQLTTINTWDDRGTPGIADDIFRISGLLNHFSRYLVMREDDGYPRLVIDTPVADAVVHGELIVSGSVSGVDVTDGIDMLVVTVMADGEGPQTIYSAQADSFDFQWDTAGRYGWQTLTAAAETSSGISAGASIKVYVDNSSPRTQIVVNQQLVEDGGLAVVPPEGDVMLIAEDSVDRGSVVQEIRYRWDDGPYATYSDIIPLDDVQAGRHSFSCYAIDDQGNQEPEQTVYITLIDSGQPGGSSSIETELTVGEPSYSDGHQQWVAGMTPLSIVAVDGSDPVYQIRYRMSDDDYQLYENPVTLDAFEEGSYEVEFFGIDYYGLTEGVRSKSIVLDASPPETTVQIIGSVEEADGHHYVSSSTQFHCQAEDGGLIPSGVSRIEYSLDDGEWQEYGEPITVVSAVDEALLSIRSTDRVGNSEEPLVFSLRFNVDAPILGLISASSHISPNGDGIKDGAIWRVGVSKVFGGEHLALLKIDGVAVAQHEGSDAEFDLAWDGSIGGVPAGDGPHQYSIELSDSHGNSAELVVGEIVVDTISPVLAVTDVMGVGGVVTLSYLIDDNIPEQNASVQLSIYGGQQLIASIPQQVAVPPPAHSISWGGVNQFAAQAVDGRYDYSILATDAAGNVSSPNVGVLSLDVRPPSSRLVIVGPQFDGGGFSWIGPSTQLMLAATDLAGSVSHIDYSVDSGGWQTYSSPFGLVTSGAHEVSHKAVDTAGNEEESKSHQLSLDDVAPVSTLNVEGVQKQIDGKTHWSGSATFVRLDSSDQGSGVGRAIFEINAPKLIYEASQSITLGNIGDGEKTATYWAVDEVGNQEGKRQLQFVINGSPPDVTLEVGNPKYGTGSFLYVDGDTPLQVVARSSDEDIVYLHYKIDGGALVPSTSEGAQELRSQQFMLADEGSHLIRYFATDSFENRRELAMSMIVDNKPPLTLMEKSQEVPGEEHLATPSTVIRLNTTDDIVGVKSTEYAIDGGGWGEYATSFDLRNLSGGEHYVSYRSRDYLDHIEMAKQQLLEILVLGSQFGRTALPRILIFVPMAGADLDIEPVDSAEVSEVKQLCDEMGWVFKLVTDAKGFLDAMRSDAFNVFAVAGAVDGYRFEGSELIDRVMRELQMRIFKGDALMLMRSSFGMEGVAWERMLGELGGTAGENIEKGSARLYYSAEDDDIYPSVVLSSGAYSIQGAVTSLFYADGSTVVGKRMYGDGHMMFVGADIESWRRAYEAAVLDREFEKTWGEMWNDLFAQVISIDGRVSPGEVVSFEVAVSTQQIPAFVVVAPEVPARAYWVTSDGGDAVSGMTWSVGLDANDERIFVYSLRLPFSGDGVDIPVVLTTSWENGLDDTSIKVSRQEIKETWSKLWAECRKSFEKLRDEPETLEGAWAMLDGILAAWDAADDVDDIEERISAVLDSFDKLSVMDAERVGELKRALGQLLESLQLESIDRSDGIISASELAIDSDGDGLSDDIEDEAGTDPFDMDSDDDGVIDGQERSALADSDGDGYINALDSDSDDDGLLDGLEMGLVELPPDPDGAGPIKSTDDEAGNVVFDNDPATTTDMTKSDTDGGGLTDDQEDINKNGLVDPGETDPNNPLDDSNPTDFAGGGGGLGCTMISGVNEEPSDLIFLGVGVMLLLLFHYKRRSAE